ncbi:MAG: amino acid ABC transporter substrate-binding protein [Ktedonobacteraceae bacterium]|nr:amino acid ABC transporter substrate-binding protein [Ktedonobacteraceae bacterium]
MISSELSRRTFLRRTGQAGGLVAAGGMLEYILAACGGNISTTTGSNATPGATKVVPAGLKNPSVLQWGADYVSGAPYVFQDPKNPKNLVGFEVEIAQAIANLMGITQTQVEIEYDNLDQALAANQFDMVMNGWEKTPDRLKTQLFSEAYYRYGQQIIVRKDDTRFDNMNPTDIKVLEGMTVGTGGGYKAETIMQGDPKIHIKAYNGTLAFSDLVQKKLDAFFLDSPIAVYYILGSGPGATPIPELKLLGKPIYTDDYFVGFNKSNPNAAKLLPKINEAFDILKKNGTLKSIYQKWQMWNDQQAEIGIM